MYVRDIMTAYPAFCTPDDSLQACAQLMVDYDCGSIPVIADQQGRKLVGMITDRDITCRTVAVGRNPLEMKVQECMTVPVDFIEQDADLDDVVHLMEKRAVRRVPVVDPDGSCCGIVSQADIAATAPKVDTADVVREISLAA